MKTKARPQNGRSDNNRGLAGGHRTLSPWQARPWERKPGWGPGSKGIPCLPSLLWEAGHEHPQAAGTLTVSLRLKEQR